MYVDLCGLCPCLGLAGLFGLFEVGRALARFVCVRALYAMVTLATTLCYALETPTTHAWVTERQYICVETGSDSLKSWGGRRHEACLCIGKVSRTDVVARTTHKTSRD